MTTFYKIFFMSVGGSPFLRSFLQSNVLRRGRCREVINEIKFHRLCWLVLDISCRCWQLWDDVCIIMLLLAMARIQDWETGCVRQYYLPQLSVSDEIIIIISSLCYSVWVNNNLLQIHSDNNFIQFTPDSICKHNNVTSFNSLLMKLLQMWKD